MKQDGGTLSGFWSDLTKRRRAVKEARLLVAEARRALHRYRSRLSERQATEMDQAIAELDQAAQNGEYVQVRDGITRLDKSLDQYLAFARKSTAREYVESICVAVLIALFLRAFVVEAFKIPSGSMIPTLQVGDHIFVNKFIYGVRVPYTNIKFGSEYRKPKRGEVIVFIYPVNPSQDFIKRIVGVEGDTVEIKDDAVWVNDKPIERAHVDGDCNYEDIDEPANRWEERRCNAFVEKVNENEYTTIYDRLPHSGHSWPKQKIPPNSVFVMGDNRDNSHDSRFWGTVPLENIKGKAMVIWWSAGDGLANIRWNRMFHLVN